MISDLQELWKLSSQGTLRKQSNVNAIDVPAYCAKISLAISQRRNVSEQKLAISIDHDSNKIPFRVASSLYYTTLRIHELQVNSLLVKSKSLVAQSKFNLVPAKRKLSYSGTQNIVKRRRVVRNTKDTVITSYTELLDETEDLLAFSNTDADGICTEVNNATATANTKRIHIREITISEEIEEDYGIGTSYLDGDEGFGDATLSELDEIFHAFADESGRTSPKKSTAIKNKATEEPSFSAKKLKRDEETLVPEALNIAEFSAGTSQQSNLTDINANFLSDNDFHVDVTAALAYLDKDNELPVKKFDHSFEPQNVVASVYSVEKKQKLIIDEKRVLTDAELSNQMQCCLDINGRILKCRAKIEWRPGGKTGHSKLYNKRRQSAAKLLSTLSRSNSAVQKNPLKYKLQIEENVSISRYRSLLRDIFGHGVDDKTATEIYTKWNKSSVQNCKRVNKNKSNMLQSLPDVRDDFINELNNSVGCDTLNNTNNNLLAAAGFKPTFVEAKEDKWSPSDVMMRILDIYRACVSKQNDIDVAYVLPVSKMNRMEAARGFSSILALTAKNYINIIARPSTIHCARICLGTASEKLILASQTTV